jgi:hypothetical protein
MEKPAGSHKPAKVYCDRLEGIGQDFREISPGEACLSRKSG